MNKFLLTSLLLLMIVPAAQAQDDVYFVPSKKQKAERKARLEAKSAAVYPEDVFVADDWADGRGYGGWDVDEYNRQGDYYAEGDTAYYEDYVEQEDESYTDRIVRFHSPSVGIYVSSPYYWDYHYDNFWWGGYYNYYRPYYWNYGWGPAYGYWGWHAPHHYPGWGWTYPGHRPTPPPPAGGGYRPGTGTNGQQYRPGRGPSRNSSTGGVYRGTPSRNNSSGVSRPSSGTRPSTRPSQGTTTQRQPSNSTSRPSSSYTPSRSFGNSPSRSSGATISSPSRSSGSVGGSGRSFGSGGGRRR